MIEAIDIRESAPADLASIEMLYPDAFPDEDLLPLVRELLRSRSDVLSLVATLDASFKGHVIFTMCGVEEGEGTVALLGPLAVATGVQRQGIGGALVKTGLKTLEQMKAQQVFVLGDPAYYGRFGFTPEARISPPYPLPYEWRGAWQSLRLGSADTPGTGSLRVPPPWRQAALWGP